MPTHFSDYSAKTNPGNNLNVLLQIEGQGEFEVEIVDSCNDWVELMKDIFDFEKLKTLFVSGGLQVRIDSLSGGLTLFSSIALLFFCFSVTL
jgi:phosphoglucomutase